MTTRLKDKTTRNNISSYTNYTHIDVGLPNTIECQETSVRVTKKCVPGLTGPTGIVGRNDEDLTYAKRVDFTNNEKVIYKGEAAVGTTESAAVWRVRRLTIATDNDVIEEWADGADTFNKIWANRYSISYS